MAHPDEKWDQKQALARPSRYYGDGGTIHASTDLDVETFGDTVVAAWFRCQRLPFRQVPVQIDRASAMAVSSNELPRLTGVEVLDRA